MAEVTITIPGTITVGDLAAKLDIPATQLIGELFKNGIMATINQKLDLETAQIIVDELGLSVQLESSAEESHIKRRSDEKLEGNDLRARPPIVAVMGHVDHGKTSLLDAILDSKVTSGEVGGITQHIAAYQTVHDQRIITLLDTPGHEAFSALRQHGAYLTDVVVIVIAADDGIKPQTIEAINFARNAEAHIVVALNKIDKPEADANRVKQQLAEQNLTPEEWGGETVVVEVSAKTKKGLDQLLDMILLVADIKELKADFDRPAEGLVIEAHQEQGRGATTNLLVAHGELKVGQYIVAGTAHGKVRTLRSWKGEDLPLAGPSTPVEITGLKHLPEFGEQFKVVESEKAARAYIEGHVQEDSRRTNISSEEVLRMISRKHENTEVPIIAKADVQGSLKSVVDSLKLLEIEEVKLKIIGSGVGDISENDVQTAAASTAVIYGFNVSTPAAVAKVAKRQNVQVRNYKVIYELIDNAKELLSQYLAPEIVETAVGRVVVKGIFRTAKDLTVCGGEVTVGKAVPGVLAKVIRDKQEIAEVEVMSVQREQQEAKEVFEGELCGLQLKTSGKLNLEEGDRLELFSRETVKRQI